MLEELPETLDETYERILRGINKANRDNAHRLLQCLTVAVRPLRVPELAEILAVDFRTAACGGTSKLNTDWRWEDQQQAVLSTCSSLISIVDEGGSQVVQFSHFSVKEYLTSARLADSSADVSRFHIFLEPAHTILAKACLGVLLRLDEHAAKYNVDSSFPLALYAAEHWVDHAKFEQVSSHIREAMEDLFDLEKPCFKAWLRVHDIDQPVKSHLHDFSSGRPRYAAVPLYYAVLCGFRELAERLIIKHPQQVDAIGGHNMSPLATALAMGNLDVAQLLYDHGAHVDVQCNDRRTPLYAATGHPKILEWLLSHGADPHFLWDYSCLHIAAQSGQLEVTRILLLHRTDYNALNNKGQTPLHLALAGGHINVAQLLLEHGVDVDVLDDDGQTPLHLASAGGHFDVAQLLLKQGVDANVLDDNRQTPLDLASAGGHFNVAQLLLKQGVDANVLDKNRSTALHLASAEGHINIVQLLLKQGVDAIAQDTNRSTALHLALEKDHIDVVKLLLQHGVDVNAPDKMRSTALHLASEKGYVDVVRLLLEHGVDANALDKMRSTALHLASEKGYVDVVRLLLEHGVDVDAQDKRRSTALHLASEKGHMNVTQLLLKHGADANAPDGEGQTPLHLASMGGYTNVAQMFLERGVDVNALDHWRSTALRRASERGHVDVARLLLELGANAQDTELRTVVSRQGCSII